MRRFGALPPGLQPRGNLRLKPPACRFVISPIDPKIVLIDEPAGEVMGIFVSAAVTESL